MDDERTPPGRKVAWVGTRRRVLLLLAVGAVTVLLAGGGFAALESQTVPGYWDGLWWALSLMTTVGFIGETPETTGGRLLSALLMVSGFALMTLTTAAIASLFVREVEEPERLQERDFERQMLDRLDGLATRLEAIERALPERGGERR